MRRDLPPAHFLGEGSSNHRSQAGCQRPDTTDYTKVCSSFSHGEQIRDGNIDQHNQSSATNTLDNSSSNKHIHVD